MPFFKIASILSLFISSISLCHDLALKNEKRIFRISLSERPKSLNPHLSKSVSISFLYPQLYRNLMKINHLGELENDLAHRCEKINLKKFKCSLKPNLRWSNGENLQANDIVNSYKQFLSSKTKSPHADFLFNLKNAEKYYSDENINLGLTIEKNSIIFDLENNDSEFLYKLASPITAIVNKDNSVYSGPYILNNTNPDLWTLEPNPHFYMKNPNQVSISILFIKENSVAISLFNQNKLDFIHRLPTVYTEKYINSQHFYKQPLVRLDYLAFPKVVSIETATYEQLIKDISTALNYDELRKLLYAPERPGCFGYTDSFLKVNKNLCYKFSNKFTTIQKMKYSKIKDFKLIVSMSGGDDSKRVSEWVQDQLKKNLDFNLKIQSLENHVFLNEYKKHIFFHRRSLTSLAPTCLHLLENFKQNHAPHLKFSISKKFNEALIQLKTESDKNLKSKLCTEQLKTILNEYSLIPLGPMEFNYLVRHGWVGIESNPLYHFDFSKLSYRN